MQNWHFVVVSDPTLRAALAALYRKSASVPGGQEDMLKQVVASAADEREAAALNRKVAPARYLTAHLHEVPIHVVPCIEGRAENLSAVEQAAWWDLASDLELHAGRPLTWAGHRPNHPASRL
jgi:nitroreductase